MKPAVILPPSVLTERLAVATIGRAAGQPISDAIYTMLDDTAGLELLACRIAVIEGPRQQ